MAVLKLPVNGGLKTALSVACLPLACVGKLVSPTVLVSAVAH